MASTIQKLNELKPSLETLIQGSGVDLTVLATLIGEQINKSLDPRQLWAIQQTLQSLENSTPTLGMLLELSRKVLENKAFIMEGFPVPSWDGSEITTTVGVCSCVTKKSKIGTLVDMTCRGLTNLVAGSLFHYETTVNYTYQILKQDLGFGKYDYLIHPLYLTGLQFNVVMLRTEKGFIKWNKIWSTPKQKELNKELLNERYEREGCNKALKGPCYKCPRNRSGCRCAVK